MGELTSNYGLFKPSPRDNMSDVKKFLTDNFKRIQKIPEPTIIPAGQPLPQTGDYEVGDRVFRADPVSSTSYPSSYILVCKDSLWGWHWRPIQTTISPWVTLSGEVLDDSLERPFIQHPTSPIQIALDSKGQCHWRGAIRSSQPGITENVTMVVFRNIPEGIRSNTNHMHTLAVTPLTANNSAGMAAFVGARYYMDNTGYGSIRCWGTFNGIASDLWFTGMRYNNASSYFYNA